MNHHSVEQAILRDCCRLAIAGTQSDVLAVEWVQQVDVEQLLSLSQHHRLVLFCYQFFILPNKSKLSTADFDRFSAEAKTIVFNQFQLIAALAKIREAFDAANVQYVLLKGPVLNTQIHDDKLLRYSRDIDILVPPDAKQLALAHDCLTRLGYSTDVSLKAMQAFARRKKFFGKKDASYLRTGEPFIVELHWKTLERAAYAQQYNWPGCVQKVGFQGVATPVLADELNVLYLCLHAASHDWLRLNWLLDIVIFMRKQLIQPAELLAAAKQTDYEVFVLEAFYLAYHCLELQTFSAYGDYAKAKSLLKRIEQRRAPRNEHPYLQMFINVYIASQFYPRLRDRVNKLTYFTLALTWHAAKKPFKAISRLFAG